MESACLGTCRANAIVYKVYVQNSSEHRAEVVLLENVRATSVYLLPGQVVAGEQQIVTWREANVPLSDNVRLLATALLSRYPRVSPWYPSHRPRRDGMQSCGPNPSGTPGFGYA